MSAHLRQAWRKVAAGALYHLADDTNFRLDPTFRPENNTTLGGDWPEPGIFLTKAPEHWADGYGYWRPYVIEFTGAVGKDYGRETFVPATNFSQMRISRVMALDGYCREEFGDWGWTEEYFETTYDTFEPISEEEMRGYSNWSGYRAPDVRGWSGSWQSRYKARVREFAKTRPGVYASVSRTGAMEPKERLKNEKKRLTVLRNEYKNLLKRDTQQVAYEFGFLPYIEQLNKVQELEGDIYGEVRTQE